ncbi:MAG: hypothetical protein J6B34_03635 [Clostridia bacterium]|nr:hypothetical protein [Clostridia bacterium]
MTNKDLFNEIGSIDPCLIAGAKENDTRGKRLTIIKWVAIVACICLAVIPVTVHFIVNPNEPFFNSQTPDRVFKFELGQECICEYDKICSIKFDSVYLTHTINDTTIENGGYLIFCGDIYTEHCFLEGDAITVGFNFSSELNDIAVFERELSIEASQAKLNFLNQRQTMDGKIALIFSICQADYAKIEEKSSDCLYDGAVPQIVLYPSVYWRGGLCEFGFSTTDVFNLDKFSY